MSSISITNFGSLNKLNNLFEKWYAHILMMHLHNISISWVNLQMETNIFYCLPHFNSLYKNRWIKFAVEIFNSLFAWFMSYSNGLKVKFWKNLLEFGCFLTIEYLNFYNLLYSNAILIFFWALLIFFDPLIFSTSWYFLNEKPKDPMKYLALIYVMTTPINLYNDKISGSGVRDS